MWNNHSISQNHGNPISYGVTKSGEVGRYDMWEGRFKSSFPKYQ